MIIFYNPDCSKCRGALELMEANQCYVEIRNYLSDPPSPEELAKLIKLLNCKPLDIIRTKEPLFQERFANKDFSDREWLQVLSEHPILIERPIIIDGSKAIIGRPPGRVLELIKGK